MARSFEFSDDIKRKAGLRQWGLCAVCGERLFDVEDHAHHVYANQSGDPQNPAHAWLRSEDNCVILCHVCHYRVHENGKYGSGALAPPDYYEFSHGKHTGQHKLWVARMRGRL